MAAVVVSSKYQIAIPPEIRTHLHLRPGQKLRMIPLDGRVELVPVPDIRNLLGFAKGMDSEVERDGDRV